MLKTKIKSYSELITLSTFEKRFQYLKLEGTIGQETFGSRRWLNQNFYHSDKWLRFRDSIIIRDSGCDLGVQGYDIYGPVLIHHLNPITYENILYNDQCVFDPENVICTNLRTHNAIHYGTDNVIANTLVERSRNDTCPWRKI